MKIVRFERGKGYTLVRECGRLDPDFPNAPFLRQILSIFREFEPFPDRDDYIALVFDPDEERMIVDLFHQISGGIEEDRGHGHGDRGYVMALNAVLTPLGRTSTSVPRNLQDDRPIVEIKEWSLATM